MAQTILNTMRRRLPAHGWQRSLLLAVALIVASCGRNDPSTGQRGAGPADPRYLTYQPVVTRPGRLSVYGPNPRYLQSAAGKPVVLVGYGNEARSRPEILDQLRGKVNYLRAYAAWFAPVEDAIGYELAPPYPKGADGLWDLASWDETFWTNLRDYLDNTAERGFIVGLTIWDGHSDLPGGKFGERSIWNEGKNAQRVQWAYDYEALTTFENPSPTSADPRERLVYYQRRFVDRLLAETAPYGHVLYELDNETDQASENWFLYWAEYIKGRTGAVVATNWGISDETLGRTALVDMKSYHERSADTITPERLALNKVIVADADTECDNLDAESARRLAWQAFVRGGHWNDFVCFGTAYPDAAKADFYEKLLRFLEERAVPFWEMTPEDGLVTGGESLAKAGSHYLVYLPEGGEATVDLGAAEPGVVFVAEWYDPAEGAYHGRAEVAGGGKQRFTPPFAGEAVLYLQPRDAAS